MPLIFSSRWLIVNPFSDSKPYFPQFSNKELIAHSQIIQVLCSIMKGRKVSLNLKMTSTLQSSSAANFGSKGDSINICYFVSEITSTIEVFSSFCFYFEPFQQQNQHSSLLDHLLTLIPPYHQFIYSQHFRQL